MKAKMLYNSAVITTRTRISKNANGAELSQYGMEIIAHSKPVAGVVDIVLLTSEPSLANE